MLPPLQSIFGHAPHPILILSCPYLSNPYPVIPAPQQSLSCHAPASPLLIRSCSPLHSLSCHAPPPSNPYPFMPRVLTVISVMFLPLQAPFLIPSLALPFLILSCPSLLYLYKYCYVPFPPGSIPNHVMHHPFSAPSLSCTIPSLLLLLSCTIPSLLLLLSWPQVYLILYFNSLPRLYILLHPVLLL